MVEVTNMEVSHLLPSLLLLLANNAKVLIVFALLYLLIKSIYKYYLLSAKLPPVIKSTLMETMKGMTGPKLPEFLLKSADNLNNYTFRLPSLPFMQQTIITGDADFAREVLMDPQTIKPSMYMETELNNIGNIFSRNGHFWYIRRKGIVPAFSSKHVQRMNQVALDKTEKWIQEKLIPWSENNVPFDVGKEMVSITLEAICETAFEYTITPQEKEEFIHNSEIQFKEFVSRSMHNPMRKYLPYWLIPERRHAIGHFEKNYQFALKIIQEYRSIPNPLKGTIMDLIVSNPCYENDYEIASDVLTYLTAGYDTTAYTIAFTLSELARHPSEQMKVQEDLLNAASTPGIKTSFTRQWKQSGVLQRAIRESMRLNPVSAGGSARLCGRDFLSKKDGYVIPKGSIVIVPPILLHRNAFVYDNAHEYIPSRWETATQMQKDHFMLFSAGKQNCVGQSLAIAEVQCIIPRILSEFVLEVHDEGCTTYFLTYKPHNVMLKAKRIIE